MTKGRLSVRPKPHNGEALSGYILRACAMNHISGYALYRSVSNHALTGIQQFDLDPGRLVELESLSNILGLTITEIESMTFSPIRRKMTDSNIDLLRGLMRGSIVSSRRRFCPKCLQEHGTYKLIWQVNEIEICDKHLVKLDGKCGNCGKPQSMWTSYTADLTCSSCGESLTDASLIRVVDEQYINDQYRKYLDWMYLLDPTTRVLRATFGELNKAIAQNLLYLAQSKEPIFDQAHIHCIDKLRLNRMTRFLLGKAEQYYITLPFLLDVLRKLNVSLAEFSEVYPPSGYLNSLNDNKADAPKCLAPWCTAYGSSSKMSRIAHRKEMLYRNRTFTRPHMCKSCSLKYGKERGTSVWCEIGEMIEIGWKKIRIEYMEGKNYRQIAQNLGTHEQRVDYFIGYFLGRHQIPVKTAGISVIQDEHTIKKYLQALVGVGTGEKVVRELFGWNRLQYWSFYHTDIVQYHLTFGSDVCRESDRKTPRRAFWESKLREEIARRLESKLPITVVDVAQSLDCSTRLLHRHGLTQIIEQGSRIAYEASIKAYMERAREYVDDRSTEVSFKGYCRMIKKSGRWVRENLPDVQGLISEVKASRFKQEKMHLIREAVNTLKSVGHAVNMSNISNVLGVYQGNLSKYSDLVRAVIELG